MLRPLFCNIPKTTNAVSVLLLASLWKAQEMMAIELGLRFARCIIDGVQVVFCSLQMPDGATEWGSMSLSMDQKRITLSKSKSRSRTPLCAQGLPRTHQYDQTLGRIAKHSQQGREEAGMDI
ncbi:hypothetical protein BXZ70DRAFT_924742 [Cristinia sonorae]|uniref:Uncharacterized protein n=1 Tax=Cristinia sonorae TaxID=1940300 RepID=A0A8K0UWH0_9AGAR|nr:hypothetical protein BXZ70DRAFT_924742 [Cristinia sonorae]